MRILHSLSKKNRFELENLKDMQLTSLEIKGFKSFGDKITIHFDEGITAVVGPNGCGKSNVVDAIRWVLGEQSTKMLRSEKMENIIFNGTKDRKPSNLAEVSLTFSNTKNVLPTEYSTVTITRKLYRSGESEYRLNDVQCRLKDITDLFLDTGIGADTYSIIELKMVDEILNNKENSRRNLFEEAAGISKYKIRKKQTFNKLKDTESDLSRVEDLLFEIEGNLKTLENQAKKTEKYYKLKEQYKILSSQLAAIKLAGFNKALEDLDKQEELHNEQKTGLLADIDKLEASLQQEKLDSLNKEKNLSIQQKSTNEHLNKIRQYENEKKLKNERLNFLQEKESRLNAELENDKRSFETTSESLKSLEQSKYNETEILQKAELILASLKQELDEIRLIQSRKKTELDQLNQQLKENDGVVYKTEKDIEIIHIQEQSLAQELLRTSSDDEAKLKELDGFNMAIAELEKDLVNQNDQLKNLTIEEERLHLELQETEDHLQKSKDKLVSEHRTLDAKQNEYSLTKSLVENLEGFPESIKFLKKNASWAKNAPLLSDVLFCKEEYRIAIENYLEPYMNYYVVDNYREAIQAVNLLSSAAKGRANFFVLESFENNSSLTAPANTPSDTISALTIIEVEDKYRKLCEFLLKDVFIIERDEENVIQQNSADQKNILLGKSGKYSRSKFSISGGSVGLFEGKRIGRAKNLEALEKEIKKIEENIFSLKNKIEEYQIKTTQLKNRSQVATIERLKNLINLKNNELTSLKTKQEQYYSFMESNRNRREDIELRIVNLAEQRTTLLPQLESLKNEKQRLEQQQQTFLISFNEINDKMDAKNSSFNEENIRFHQQKNKTENIAKDIEYRQAQSANLEVRIKTNTEELEKTAKDVQEIVKTSDLSDVDLIAMYEQKEAMEKAVQEAEQDHYASRGKITEIEEQINHIRRSKEQAETVSFTIRDKKNELRLELNSLKERLSVEFNIELNDIADNIPLEDLTEEEVKKKTERTKDQLDNFGAINPLAVEAYQEMNQRYTFINEQKADLVKAKESLIQTIAEIDETAKAKFMESFIMIRDNFQRVFRSLFNEEDSCDLILLNPEDPLESDIDIMAKPKGKRPLTINQLSGGEKTLTATAILFSLYLLKPAPFCIFDEVDAPLDDTNIDKFNNIIRKFSDESQFIIVTHNKRTIASTDVVYGVTMVEQGVSRVVPVDLRKLETAA